MKICIFGAGAIGGYMSAKLAAAGADVSLPFANSDEACDNARTISAAVLQPIPAEGRYFFEVARAIFQISQGALWIPPTKVCKDLRHVQKRQTDSKRQTARPSV